MDPKFLTPYNPHNTEDEIYTLWEKSGFFNPDNLPKRHERPYSIIMPPPNANGSLHAGHALFVTFQDALVRFHRMRGKKALWLPGADHAGFETQLVYENKLRKEGRSRFKMKRGELYREIMDFTLHNKRFMEEQLRELGASCDWSRERFTLDPDVIKAVYKTFKKLYDDGLIYRGNHPVNWSTKYQTSLSQLETKAVERKDPLYYIRYGPFVLATVRPETKFGDTAVAVHPDDKRYKGWIGKEIEFDSLIGTVRLKVIADEYVDPEFGTGVVKITPAHDPNDFDVGERHNLETREVIDQYGRLNDRCGKYAGLKIKEARGRVTEDLQKAGLLEKVDEQYAHMVLVNYKDENDLIEPRVMPQWFVKTQPLGDMARKAVEQGEIRFVSEQFKKVFFHWLDNLQDWNISRQIVWGIPIPAWFRGDEIHIGESVPEGGGWVRDPDTFDTWFSSGQWPFVTLGFPDHRDFKTYYPTSVLETGYDILFFWVMRMIMLGLYRTGKVPFRDIYLHGLVRDAERQKMSKSKGNVINPLEISEKYGTDALRMALIVGNTPGTDLALSVEKIKAYKHFANKFWNIARFILSNTQNVSSSKGFTEWSSEDQRLREERDTILIDTTKDIEEYRLYLASEKLYHYVWDRLASELLEGSKKIFGGEEEELKLSRRLFLYETLSDLLKMLHPFMPFVTEEIWQSLPHRDSELLMVAPWPVPATKPLPEHR